MNDTQIQQDISIIKEMIEKTSIDYDSDHIFRLGITGIVVKETG